MLGNMLIIILLMPIVFQVVYLAVTQAKRHSELMALLTRIEEQLSQSH